MKKAARGQLPAPAAPAKSSTPALESRRVAALLRMRSLRSLSREIKPNASHERSVTKAAPSYSSTAAGFQFTLCPGPWALLEGVFFAIRHRTGVWQEQGRVPPLTEGVLATGMQGNSGHQL